MKELIHSLQLITLREQSQGQFFKLSFTDKTPEPKRLQPYRCFELEARFEIPFKAQPDMLHHAIRQAKQRLVHHLFKDLRSLVMDAQQAVLSGDADQCLEILGQLENEMSPGSIKHGH